MTKTKTKTGKQNEIYTENADDENVLSMYLKEINRIPLLSREEENEYATRAAEGDEIAKHKLVQANLRFVVNVAKKYQNQGLPLSDLISEGNIGLMNAIERYDVTKGYHFISYAVWWIRQAILKAVCEKSRMIRLPLNRANELVQIDKARKQLQREKNGDPEVDDIAKELNMDEKHVADLINISRDLVSLETPMYSEKDSAVLSDFVEDFGYESPDQRVLGNSLREDINQVLDSLTEKESEIIQYRFGLNGRSPLSLKEIGDRYELTKERIRQIEKKAIKRLQHPSRSALLESYMG
ncbi:MAG: RNA polymerase sigma factor RpoD/SigA [Spirochaetales bacterium]|nr:RNA polymerase sigma factor RpoD/SigA [Spirochaetales bacterium]MCF7937305.1 RNA polymerase sigma factor RpoD/SigA [Spirochaetales bacterium]